MTRPLLVALALVALAARASADDLPQWGQGPFEVSDPGFLAQLRLDPYARSPRTLEPGHVELSGRYVMENTSSWDDDTSAFAPGSFPEEPLHRVTIAAETRDIRFVARVGVFPRVELGLELGAVHWQGGGILDKIIRDWHNLVGTTNTERSHLRRNAYAVQAIEPDGRVYTAPGPLTGLGDGAATARVLALEGSDAWPAVAFTLRTWIPVSNRSFGHAHGTAETLQVDLSKRLFDWPILLYASGAYTYYDECTLDDLSLVRHRFMGAFGIEWEIDPVFSIVVHYMEESRREASLWRHTDIVFGNYLQYIAFGVKIQPVPGFRIEVGAIEHVLDPDVTGTFGVLLNLSWEFDAGALLSGAAPAPAPGS
jgi:hypothetical protein